MTSITPLSLLKSHAVVEHDLDDALLQHKLAAAEQWITNHIGSPFVAGEPAMTEAALQLAAFWYEQREAVGIDVTLRPAPFGVHELLSSFKQQVTGHVPE